jgi:hypothetical protein
MDKLKTHEAFLCKLVSTRAKNTRTLLIKGAKPQQLDAICEIILNTIKGVIPIEPKLHTKFKKYKLVLRKLVKKCLKKTLRKKLILKYFKLISDLIAAVLPICGLIGSFFS